MPELSGIDLSQTYKPEPTGVQEFFSKLGKSYKDQSDRVEIGKLIEEYQNNRQDANAWENLQLGLEKSNVSPTRRLETQKALNEMQKGIVAKDKALNASVKQDMAKQAGRGALNILQRQREILATGHLGPKFATVGTGRKLGSTFSKEGQRVRAEYKRLGKSLIQQSSNIPIRNRQEFETLAADLYNTDLTNEEIAGSLDAMERIIKETIGEETSPQKAAEQVPKSIEKPSLSSFRS